MPGRSRRTILEQVLPLGLVKATMPDDLITSPRPKNEQRQSASPDLPNHEVAI